jgi:proteasome assembly chaperone (PAC2) family protein
MLSDSIQIEHLPNLEEPLLIVGFEGWGNALDISRGMVNYFIGKMKAQIFGKIDSDLFYRYDENRPLVKIQDGLLEDLSPPGGFFYAAERELAGRDIVLLKATEPTLRWFQFTDALASLCKKLGVKTVFSLGSMYDNVLHTDTVISALVSSKKLLPRLKEKNVMTVSYEGPGAIHSLIHKASKKQGIECISLWCHCPYYLQGTTHFGLLSHLGSLLASLGGFKFDGTELETTWRELGKEIQGIIDKNPELQGMIQDLRKAKIKGSWDTARKGDKVIHLEDFMKPR